MITVKPSQAIDWRFYTFISTCTDLLRMIFIWCCLHSLPHFKFNSHHWTIINTAPCIGLLRTFWLFFYFLLGRDTLQTTAISVYMQLLNSLFPYLTLSLLIATNAILIFLDNKITAIINKCDYKHRDVWSQIKQIWDIFTYLKLWVAGARQNLKWVKT